MPTEAEVKSEIIKLIRAEGGYGRRIEDQFSVGMPDMVLIPKDCPVFFVEAKIIRVKTFGVTPRQMEELRRIHGAAPHGVHAVPVLLGYGSNTKRLYLVPPAEKTTPDVGVFCERPWNISKLLMDYYNKFFTERNDGIAS